MPDLTYVLEAPGELMTLPAQVSDPARRRRIRHRQANVLTVAIRATVAGMRGVAAVAEWAAQVPHEGRARRGDRGLPRQPRYVTPSEPALRRPLQKLDVDGVDQELGRFRAPRAPGPGGRRGWHDGAGGPQPRRHAGPLLGSGVHQGGVIGQRQVNSMSNAITAFQPRLAPIDLTSVVETAEALHTQREHARCLVQDKHANNLFVAKGNQPALAEALQWLDPGSVSLPGSAGGEGARPDRDAHSPGQHRAH